VREPEYLAKVLSEGADQADEVATRTLDQAKRAMGFTLRGDIPKF